MSRRDRDRLEDMRTVLVHRYFEIDLDVVRKTVDEDVPKLERAVRALLGRLGDDDP